MMILAREMIGSSIHVSMVMNMK